MQVSKGVNYLRIFMLRGHSGLRILGVGLCLAHRHEWIWSQHFLAIRNRPGRRHVVSSHSIEGFGTQNLEFLAMNVVCNRLRREKPTSAITSVGTFNENGNESEALDDSRGGARNHHLYW
jgi:hypothetical protein